jgi:phage protein U
MTSKLMSLGMFVFSIPTLAYDELQRRSSWRVARNAVVGAKDALQFLGADLDTVSLSGSAPAEISKGRASIDQLREMAAQGEAWPLVDGSGNVWGAYIITGIDERQSHFMPDGTARMIDFAIDLLEAGDAGAGSSYTAGGVG